MQNLPPLPSTGVLLVDDSCSERLLVRVQLELLGYRVIEADGGREALRLLEERHVDIDLILLDIEMPDIGGYELASRIRQRERQASGRWRPIVFLSSICSPEQMLLGVDSGGDDFLCKPADARVLAARLKALVRIAQLYRTARCRGAAMVAGHCTAVYCRCE